MKTKTIKFSLGFHNKIMQMKYSLGYEDAEDLIRALVEIAEELTPADQLIKVKEAAS